MRKALPQKSDGSYGTSPGKTTHACWIFHPIAQKPGGCSGTPSQQLSGHITSSHCLQMRPGPSQVKTFLRAPPEVGASPRPSPLPGGGKGWDRCSPTPGIPRCGFRTNIYTRRGSFCGRKHTLSKIGNVESLVQNEGMKLTLFTISWIPWTCKPFFQKRSCERHFLKSGYLSYTQESQDDATIEGLLLRGSYLSPWGQGIQQTQGQLSGTHWSGQPSACPFVNWLITAVLSPKALWPTQNQVIDSGVYCSTAFIKTNSVRKQQKNVFSHFFQLFCLATLLHISSK